MNDKIKINFERFLGYYIKFLENQDVIITSKNLVPNTILIYKSSYDGINNIDFTLRRSFSNNYDAILNIEVDIIINNKRVTHANIFYHQKGKDLDMLNSWKS